MNNTGIVGGNPVNNASDKNIRNRSKFNLSYHQMMTARFGELNSHFVQECVPGDKINLRSVHDLRTLSLKAPLMQNIELKKDYFNVPMEAILPLNWDKIYTNPTLGDDIDATKYGCTVSLFYRKIANYLSWIAGNVGGIADTSVPANQRLQLLFRFIAIGDTFFSRGSLMWQLGYHVTYPWSKKFHWDDRVEELLTAIQTGLENGVFGGNPMVVTINGSYCNIYPDGYNATNIPNNYKYMYFRQWLDYIHSNADWDIYTFADPTTANAWFTANGLDTAMTLNPIELPSEPINLSRVFAYQLVCAHYYSNDAVDYIYSAELMRQYLFSLYDEYARAGTLGASWYDNLGFVLNGIRMMPDYLSADVFDTIINDASVVTLANASRQRWFYQFLVSAFGFKNSLRFLDYFSGSKTRPLAVGNVDVDTSGASVSVVEITRNIQVQKFLNSVQRSGRKFSNYIKELFGENVAPDYHNPFYLAHTNDIAVAVEVENTGSNQLADAQSVTAVVKSNSKNFAFEFEADRPSILLGVFYFDISRAYPTQLDKQLFHRDRFDMFNPYLQFIGDQDVAAHEYDSLLPYSTPFGYQLRYGEYKQRVNRMIGGFVDKLPGFAFGSSKDAFDASTTPNVSPTFIRSHPFELDEFYISLTFRSLDGYFHFIIDFYNEVDASRPMAFAPSIL